jgi:hypothetical protein
VQESEQKRRKWEEYGSEETQIFVVFIPKKGATFLIIDGCSDKGSGRFEDDLRIYAAFARRNGAPEDVVEKAVRMQRESLHYVLPEREVSVDDRKKDCAALAVLVVSGRNARR